MLLLLLLDLRSFIADFWTKDQEFRASSSWKIQIHEEVGRTRSSVALSTLFERGVVTNNTFSRVLGLTVIVGLLYFFVPLLAQVVDFCFLSLRSPMSGFGSTHLTSFSVTLNVSSGVAKFIDGVREMNHLKGSAPEYLKNQPAHGQK